jgi:LEA14-like dessication related protein
MDYCYRFIKFNIGQLSWDRVIITPILSLYNISDIGFYLTAYKIDIYVNGKFVSKAYSGVGQYLSPNGESQLSVTIDFSPKVVFSDIDATMISSFLDTSKLMIGFKGVLSVKSGVVTAKNIYLQMEDSLKNWLASDPNAEYTCAK